PRAHRTRIARRVWGADGIHESFVLAARAKVRRGDRWRASQWELFPAGRRHEHRSDIQYAELESFSRRRQGISGRDEQLHCRHGRRWGWADQYRDAFRIEPIPRDGIRILA